MRVLMPLLSKIDNLSKKTGIFISYFIIAITVLVVFEVIARYIFNSPTSWSSILVQFIFGGYFVIGGAYCLLLEGHVKVDFVYSKFSGRGKAIMDIISSILFFVFTFTILYFSIIESWESTVSNETTGMAWDVLIWPYKWILPVATLLLILQGLAKLVRDIYIALKG